MRGNREQLLSGYVFFGWGGDGHVLKPDRSGGCITVVNALHATELFLPFEMVHFMLCELCLNKNKKTLNK